MVSEAAKKEYINEEARLAVEQVMPTMAFDLGDNMVVAGSADRTSDLHNTAKLAIEDFNELAEEDGLSHMHKNYMRAIRDAAITYAEDIRRLEEALDKELSDAEHEKQLMLGKFVRGSLVGTLLRFGVQLFAIGGFGYFATMALKETINVEPGQATGGSGWGPLASAFGAVVFAMVVRVWLMGRRIINIINKHEHRIHNAYGEFAEGRLLVVQLAKARAWAAWEILTGHRNTLADEVYRVFERSLEREIRRMREKTDKGKQTTLQSIRDRINEFFQGGDMPGIG